MNSWKNIGLLIILLLFLNTCKQAQPASKDFPWWLNEYRNLYKENPREASKAWFLDARMGLFVHLNLASLCENGKADYLEFTEGRASDRLLEFIGLERKEYESSDHKDSLLFSKYVLPEFDAEEICQLAARARMQYITLTTQHLGRIYNFNTEVSSFNSMNAPCKRDLVAEMASACRKYGLGLFLYLPPEYARTDPEKVKHNRKVLTELLTNYGPVSGIWFDGIGEFYKNPEGYKDLAGTYNLIRTLQPHCLISFKEGTQNDEDFISPEHFMLAFDWKFDEPGRMERWNIRRERWERQSREEWEKSGQYKLREINTVMQECYNRDAKHVPSGWINDESARHLNLEEVWNWLEYSRHCDANLLLNIGPRSKGSVHPQDEKVLLELGRRIESEGWPERKHASLRKMKH